MEKIKMDYFKFWIFSFCVYMPLFFLAVLYGLNQISQAPMHLLVICGIVFYIFILEKLSFFGYYINSNGILHKGILTSWDRVSIKKDCYIWKIILEDRNKKIYFDKFYQKSIVSLVNKYCPQDHDLYKIVKEYAIENKIPFGNEVE